MKNNRNFLCLLLVVAFLVAMIPKRESLATALPETHTFSVVWLADTQNMAYFDYPEALESMGSWIVENRIEENIACVVQTGDLVDNGWAEWQWRNYDKLHDQFAGEIPFFFVAGNHDLGVKLQKWDAYLSKDFVREVPRSNTFERGKAIYGTFDEGGEKFIIIGAGYGAEKEAAAWINRVLETHRDYTAILLFHRYIKAGGEYSAVGKEMFELLVKPNQNVRLILCGHFHGNTAYRFEEIDDDGDGTPDRTVNALMYNYQDWEKDCGQMRLLTFDVGARSITVNTFSPYTGKNYRDDYFKAAQFTIQNAF